MKFDCQFQDRTSLRFKRAARLFVRDRDEAIELIAFVETVGLPAAKHIFGWGYAQVQAYRELLRHVDASAYVVMNQSSLGVDDGVAVVHAMQAGGWRRGMLPPIARRSVRELQHKGLSLAEIARLMHMKRDALAYALRPVKTQSASAFGALGIG